jgi:DNA-binding CsgD family transcriptional regulator
MRNVLEEASAASLAVVRVRGESKRSLDRRGGAIDAPSGPTRVLTGRQEEVVALIAAGCSHEEVGRMLGISPRTARMHSDVIRRKLGVERRSQIAGAYFVQSGGLPRWDILVRALHASGNATSAP